MYQSFAHSSSLDVVGELIPELKITISFYFQSGSLSKDVVYFSLAIGGVSLTDYTCVKVLQMFQSQEREKEVHQLNLTGSCNVTDFGVINLLRGLGNLRQVILLLFDAVGRV